MKTTHTLNTLFLSAPDVAGIVRRKGLKACLTGIADNIRADFLRWESFDKSARVAASSRSRSCRLACLPTVPSVDSRPLRRSS